MNTHRYVMLKATGPNAKVLGSIRGGAEAFRDVEITAAAATLSHDAFRGKTIVQKDFTGEGDGDNNGHGTHCAGTIFSAEKSMACVSEQCQASARHS